MNEPPGLQNKMVKNMDVREWDAAIEHCGARDESMAHFAARAFRQMRERDRAGPMLTPPQRQPERAAPAFALRAAPVRVESAADLAALMSGIAAMASASNRPVPRDVMREAAAAVRDSVRAARGKPPIEGRNPAWPRGRAAALQAPRAAE